MTLNLTRSGFRGAFEVHVGYGQISIPGQPLVAPLQRACMAFDVAAGFILCISAPCPAMSYTKSEDLVEGDSQPIVACSFLSTYSESCLGQGSVFRGEFGDGSGRIKVFALTGSDVTLQLM